MMNTSGASAAVVEEFVKEAHIVQLASVTCQHACRLLGCCQLETGLCLVMKQYTLSAASHLDTLPGEAN